jgi:hypothetical protein
MDFEGNTRDETVSDGDATETQRGLGRIVTGTEELEEGQETNLNQVSNHRLFESGVGAFVLRRGVLDLTLYLKCMQERRAIQLQNCIIKLAFLQE